MARIRTIKPELWTDPEFVECSPNARLLFLAALNFASDFGVMADKPVQLKMQCFPGDDIAIVPLVDELVEHGFWIRRTAPDGSKVLVIRTFLAHQRVDKPQQGRWGNPAEWPAFVEPSPIVPRTVDERSGTEGNGMDGKEGKDLSRPAAPSEFDRFWQTYPRREGKGAAQRAFDKAVKKVGVDEVMGGLNRVLPVLQQKHREGYCPHPSTWLNEARWADEPSNVRPIVKAGTQAGNRASALGFIQDRLAQQAAIGAGDDRD